MEQRARTYTFSIFLFSLVLLFFSFAGFEFALDFQQAFIIFVISAIIFEIRAIRIPHFGFLSMGLSLYYAVLILYGLPEALLIACIGLFFRAVARKYTDIWFRLLDWSIFIFNFTVAGLIFRAFGRGNIILSGENIFALIASAAAYYILDYIINIVAVGLSIPENQSNYNSYKTRVSFANYSLIPLGAGIALSYNISPYYLIIFIPVMIVINLGISYAVSSLKFSFQEDLKEEYKRTKSELVIVRKERDQMDIELKEKIDETSLYFELGQSLGANLSLESVLDTILSMASRLLNFQSCVIFLVKDGKLFPARFSSPYKETLEMFELLKIDETFVTQVLQTKKPLLIQEVTGGEETRIFKDENSIMCAPLIIQNVVIGVIYLGDTQYGAFTKENLQVLYNLATASSLALKSAQLYASTEDALSEQQRINEQLDNKVEQLSLFFELGRELGATLNLEDTLKIILEMCKKMVDYQSCIIFLVKGEDYPEFYAPRYNSPYGRYFKDIHIKLHEGILGWVAVNRKPLLLEDVKNSVLLNIIEHERCVLAIPLIAENQVIGVIYFGNKEPRTFTEEQLNLMTTVGYQAAMAIKNAEFYEKIAAMAITDGLTGLYTHRYFQERLEEEIKWADRYQKPISLIFVDIDNFKKFNDTLGHPSGDSLLREIAILLKGFTRESDLVCRYGGDEFVLIMVEIDKSGAITIAERIREGFTLKFGEYPVKITASIGVAAYPEDADNKPDLIAEADRAAYRSKKEGKNKVTSSEKSNANRKDKE